MVSIPFQLGFLAVLLVYALYAAAVGLNPRWPVYGALLVLLLAAVAEGLGSTGAANQLALDVVFLLAVGVALIAFDRWRGRARSAPTVAPTNPPGADPAEQREPASQHPLHDLEGQGVAPVDASGQEDDEHEESGDREPDQG
jgi:hypothetical protein